MKFSVAMTLQDGDVIVSDPGQDRGAKALLRSKKPLAAAYNRFCGGHSGLAPGKSKPTTALWLHTVQLSECRAYLLASQPVCILTAAPRSLPRLRGCVGCIPLQRPSLHRQWTHLLTAAMQLDDCQLFMGRCNVLAPAKKRAYRAEKPMWG